MDTETIDSELAHTLNLNGGVPPKFITRTLVESEENVLHASATLDRINKDHLTLEEHRILLTASNELMKVWHSIYRRRIPAARQDPARSKGGES